MKVRVYYDDRIDFGEKEYHSNYFRINAKGIKEEAKQELIKHFGYKASNYKIIDLIRV